MDGAPLLRALGIKLLTGEDEVAAADSADHFLPEQVDAISGHDTELEVRLVLKHRRGCREHDVGEQDVLGVKARRAGHSRHHRRLEFRMVLWCFSALPQDLVTPPPRLTLE